MNCVTEKCIHCKLKSVSDDKAKYFKIISVPYCDIGGNVTYPFIDNGEPLNCKQYKKQSDTRELL